jgi:hypothetical protein
MRLPLMCCVLVLLGLGPRQGPSTLIDHHQHFFSEAVTAFTPALPVVTADDLVPLLDAAAISRAVIFSQGYQFGNPNRPPVDDEYAKVKAENDQPAGCSLPRAPPWVLWSQPVERLCGRRGRTLREGSAFEVRRQDALRQLRCGRAECGTHRAAPSRISNGKRSPYGDHRAPENVGHEEDRCGSQPRIFA